MRKFNLLAGSSVEIRESDKGWALSIVPIQREVTSLTEMISRITKKNSHGATDWGCAVGKEVW